MIKIANIEEITEVTRLALALWNNNNFDELKIEMNEIISNSNSIVALFYDNDNAVGFAQCGLRFDYVEGTKSSPVGYLEGIYVDEAYRKQGIAKSILKYCEKWATQRGCTEFASDCEITNIDSFEFHMRLGFIESNRIICFNKKIGENNGEN